MIKNNQEKPKVVRINKALEILECSRGTFYQKYKKKLTSITDPDHNKRQLYYLDEVNAIKAEIEESKPFTLVK